MKVAAPSPFGDDVYTFGIRRDWPELSGIINKAWLIELLEQGRHRAMTLISAPAGYGKSILASQWLETCQCPGAWVSLDENDNDLRLFLTYLLEAVQNMFPTTNLKSKNLLQSRILPPAKALSLYLLNELEQAEEPFILVLDDYHHIKETAVHNLLVELLRYSSPMVHIAVLTRHDPALHISALRARDQLTEIAVEHLRFTLAETQAFLERFLHVPIDEDTASVMEEKTEGWVTGLRLTALSVSQKGDLNNTLQGLKQGSHYVQEYLIREVLSQVPPAFSQYLMETSILDRFSAPLCDVLHSLNRKQKESGDEELSGQAFIDWLKETNLLTP